MNLSGVQSIFWEYAKRQSNLVLVVFFVVKVSIAYRGRIKAGGEGEEVFLRKHNHQFVVLEI